MSTILRLISNLARLGLKTLAFIIKNPIKSLMILLTTILGPLWPFAIPLRMIGFGAGGVVGGKFLLL